MLYRFRWVECQLNALRNCINVLQIRRELKKLPKTLDDTYARILQNIPEDSRKVAHTALQLLAVSFRPLTVEEAANATAVDYENEKYDPILQRPRDPNYILKLCSGLIMARPDSYYPPCNISKCKEREKGVTVLPLLSKRIPRVGQNVDWCFFELQDHGFDGARARRKDLACILIVIA